MAILHLAQVEPVADSPEDDVSIPVAADVSDGPRRSLADAFRAAESGARGPDDNAAAGEPRVEADVAAVGPHPTPRLLPLPLVREELELAHNALFTEPGDSSAWFYHKWLVQELTEHIPAKSAAKNSLGQPPKAPTNAGNPATVAAVVDILKAELATVQEIAAMERCKWPLLAAARLVTTLHHVHELYPEAGAGLGPDAPQLQ